jgi:hypothetical protein
LLHFLHSNEISPKKGVQKHTPNRPHFPKLKTGFENSIYANYATFELQYKEITDNNSYSRIVNSVGAFELKKKIQKKYISIHTKFDMCKLNKIITNSHATRNNINIRGNMQKHQNNREKLSALFGTN